MALSFPEKLNHRYEQINSKFSRVKDSWKLYADEIIPEDEAFANEIIEFMIDLITYICENYDSLDIQKHQKFLANYDKEFLYGPITDNHNYLSFDENLDGEPMTEFCWELQDHKAAVSKKKLEQIKQKYCKLQKKYASQKETNSS